MTNELSKCPYCESTNLKVGFSEDTQGKTIAHPVQCNACGRNIMRVINPKRVKVGIRAGKPTPPSGTKSPVENGIRPAAVICNICGSPWRNIVQYVSSKKRVRGTKVTCYENPTHKLTGKAAKILPAVPKGA